MAKLLITGTHGTDDPTRASLPFHVGRGAVEAGHEVGIVLAGDSPVLLKHMSDLLINPAEDAPLSNMGRLSKLLKRVSVLIIIFGSVTRDWVQYRLKTAVEIAVKNKCPLKLCGVYLAPMGEGVQQQVALDSVLAPFPIYLFHSPDDLGELLGDFLTEDGDGGDALN
jgi:hypothetical protein